MTELDLSNSFGSSYNHIDHSVLTNSSRISHEQTHIDQDVSVIRRFITTILLTKVYVNSIGTFILTTLDCNHETSRNSTIGPSSSPPSPTPTAACDTLQNRNTYPKYYDDHVQNELIPEEYLFPQQRR